MKKFIIGFCAVVGLGLTSCDNFLDVNEDPNNPVSTTPNYLLPSIIGNGLQVQLLTELRVGQITQNVAGRTANIATDQYFFTPGNSTSTFNNTYYLVGSNIGPMIASAEAEGSPYYVGAGKAMKAIIMAHLTDMLGDVPYTEAWQGYTNIAPKYDPQEQIYATIFTLLDEAEVEFSKPATENKRPFYTNNPVSGDILYQGDVSKWIKLVNSLKARQLNHLTKKASYNPDAVLAAIDKGIKSNADDAVLGYRQPTSVESATTSIFGPTRANFASYTFGKMFVNLLNGTTLLGDATAADDPRFPIISPTLSNGAVPGAGSSPALAATDFHGGFYTTDNSPFPIVTNAEMRFIEAEAAFRKGDKVRAFNAYKAGITAHMTKLGVAAAAQTTYMTSAAVAQSETTLTLKNIMEQKYIAMFLNPESWSDMRRFDFDETIYPGYQEPTGVNALLNGKFVRRMPPAQTETQFNPAEVARMGWGAQDYVTLPVWWDQQ
ncbi:SusD/RagB family nutrient-binding outer membrane lipoprotein [Rufibacter latericius]|uniref:SusD/RagB family nutrient-binding outer membrane lipoprotein n=1 Tax=Rufibacter latericius TaxID=2487040 RepID=A0A3M9MNB5_9BACT|nr:SusD/RagB family nutrient-binding outer membrane lipoprotein [Rufibacter latericius]RNI27009.1 SusD/RagB family nutrient-binding outer membrane lipoprotein [Rufibacter latericius]